MKAIVLLALMVASLPAHSIQMGEFSSGVSRNGTASMGTNVAFGSTLKITRLSVMRLNGGDAEFLYTNPGGTQHHIALGDEFVSQGDVARFDVNYTGSLLGSASFVIGYEITELETVAPPPYNPPLNDCPDTKVVVIPLF